MEASIKLYPLCCLWPRAGCQVPVLPAWSAASDPISGFLPTCLQSSSQILVFLPFTSTTTLLYSRFDQICNMDETSCLIQEKGEREVIRLVFMRSLRARPGLRDLWKRHNVSMLASIFLVLRCARLNWHKAPRPPYNVDEHCKTARAIDAFLAVDNLAWSGFDA